MSYRDGQIISISVENLFQDYFGFKPQQFDFGKLPVLNQKSKKGVPLYDIDQFGETYFMPVTLKYTPDDGTGGAVQTLKLSYPSVEVDCRKNMVITELTKRGSVKELISNSDFRFRIRGFIIGANNQWPEDELQALEQLYEQQQSMVIQSAITDIFLMTKVRGGNDKVVIENLHFPAGRGDIRVRAYEMELVSDENFSLEEI
ncbi:MAG: hypothetical protein H0X33_14450 [Taibaiella sp.]|nr:hypothetical protein [Taibaiella sp.]